MTEWRLMILLAFVACMLCLLMLYPLRQQRTLLWFAAPILLSLMGGAYFLWGDFTGWQSYTHRQQSHQAAQQLLRSVKSPQELIDKLQAKLKKQPQSAQGWYLLGRLYATNHQQDKATHAFATAHALSPDQELYTVHYAHSLWQLNHQSFTPQIMSIFKQLLQKNPQQTDALAMLALNAYDQHAYEEAIGYWQRLLALVPEQSEEALAIRKAIVKARNAGMNPAQH